MEFQFQRAACAQAGWKGPLHRCSFYGNKEVGQRLNATARFLFGGVDPVLDVHALSSYAVPGNNQRSSAGNSSQRSEAAASP